MMRAHPVDMHVRKMTTRIFPLSDNPKVLQTPFSTPQIRIRNMVVFNIKNPGEPNPGYFGTFGQIILIKLQKRAPDIFWGHCVEIVYLSP